MGLSDRLCLTRHRHADRAAAMFNSRRRSLNWDAPGAVSGYRARHMFELVVG